MRQSDIFLEGEGDRWLERNRAGLGQRDRVSDAIARLDIKPEHVLEIGCADGWRLAALHEKYDCSVLGVDPSREATWDARARNVPVFQATAASLPIRSNAHDVVIYGFCLYLADPADWFDIVKEGNRVLKTGGYLIVHDFAPETPFARQYEHCDGVMSYHVDFSKFWLASPLYEVAKCTIYPDDEMVTVLRKLPLSLIEVLP